MRRIASILLCLLAVTAQPVAAHTMAYGDVDAVIGFDPETGERPASARSAPRPSAITATPVRRKFGPFQVIDTMHAVLRGATDERTPAVFEAMMREFPHIATLEMAYCPGTHDDRANLRLGRMIRANGLATYVPEGGYVASGAVELFIAGVQRYAEPSARFAVHSWEDYSGIEPGDLPLTAPQNMAYLDYYRAMGMSEQEAMGFYAMTNSVPFESYRMLSAAEMAQWIAYDTQAPAQSRAVALAAGGF